MPRPALKLEHHKQLFCYKDVDIAKIAFSYLERLADRVSVRAIANTTGISRRTLYDWYETEYESMGTASCIRFILFVETNPALREIMLEEEPASYPTRRGINGHDTTKTENTHEDH